jgi:hypothetical protein
LISESKVTVDGFPGRDYRVEAPPQEGEIDEVHRFDILVVLAGDRAYQMIYGAPMSQHQDAMKRAFFDTFRITKD